MAVASIPVPDMNLSIKITRPRGSRVRMALLMAALWVAGRVAPADIDVSTEIRAAE